MVLHERPSLMTQIGGKYSPIDDSIFKLKRKLTAMQLTVRHPIADSIMSTSDGRALAFDASTVSFLAVERDYYDSISSSSFHVVCNQFMDIKGYIGESALLEIAFAMSHGRPVVLLHPPVWKPGLKVRMRSIVESRLADFRINDLLSLSASDGSSYLESVVVGNIDYELSGSERSYIASEVDALFRSL
jgi:hypothetical protein